MEGTVAVITKFHIVFGNLNLQERDLWGGLGVDGRTILEWTLKR